MFYTVFVSVKDIISFIKAYILKKLKLRKCIIEEKTKESREKSYKDTRQANPEEGAY